jgi:outer membrane protein assembly factor BamD (BamD/ComL family)
MKKFLPIASPRSPVSSGLLCICLTLLVLHAGRIWSAEDLSEEARGFYTRAQKALVDGEAETALNRFQSVVKRYPRTELAALSLWEIFRIEENLGDVEGAFATLDTLIIQQPGHFAKAHAEQFRLVQRLLGSAKENRRTLDQQRRSAMTDPETLLPMLETIIRNGPHAEVGIQAHFYLAIALEKTGKKAEAILKHEEFLDAYPKHELADDAGYQIAYISYKGWKNAPDSRQREHSAVALSFFIARFPESDKVAQARMCLAYIRSSEQRELTRLARYYESRGDEKAATIYYQQLALKFPELATAESPMRDRILKAIGEAGVPAKP